MEDPQKLTTDLLDLAADIRALAVRYPARAASIVFLGDIVGAAAGITPTCPPRLLPGEEENNSPDKCR